MFGENNAQAWELLEQAYRAQIEGELDRAVALYKHSLRLHPTAEAHTFLGWTYHFQGKIDDAIAECKRAIEVDPDFGNPYNDIGAYLMDLKRYDEAISWLERAIEAPRYEPRHYPYFNLGRVYYSKGMINRARGYFQEALRIEPEYALARQAIENIRRMVN
jgi:Tfp pilus assembly protein PilF